MADMGQMTSILLAAIFSTLGAIVALTVMRLAG
jgi:hypothetical protein